MIFPTKHKRDLSLPFFILILTFSRFQITSPYTFDGYQIRDLQDSTFASDASTWTYYPSVRAIPYYTTCGTTLLLGGSCILGYTYSPYQMNAYFQRIYTGLPAHNSLRISFTFWAIDSWDSGDGFSLYFDGSYPGWYLTYSSFPSQICGSGGSDYQERYFNIFVRLPHSASTLTMRVISLLDEESCNESFGFRDVTILMDQNAAPSTTTICGVDTITSLSNSCGCSVGTYLSSGGSCLACNSLCASCYGAGADSCYECVNSANVIYDGTECLQCTSPCATCTGASTNCVTCVSNYYLIPWTNQCVIRCPWPLVICTSYPTQCCSPCDEDQFVMTDGTTCSSTCPAPYQPMNEMSVLKTYQPGELTVVKICLVPCSPIEYLYWDGTCGQDCGSPLVITDTGYDGRKLCTFPCTYDYQYAYWDGSCASSCDPPRITHLQNGRRICREPCLDGQYLYWTDECVDSCPTFHTITTIQGILYCDYPCEVDQYLYWNGICRDTCPFPLTLYEQNISILISLKFQFFYHNFFNNISRPKSGTRCSHVEFHQRKGLCKKAF